MDDFLSLLVIVFTIIGMVSKNKKKKEQQAEAQKAFREMPPVPAPQAVKQQPAAAPEATMLPPRPEHNPTKQLEAMIAQVLLDAKTNDGARQTDHSAHVSCEGHDPCHEEQLQPLVRPAHAAVQESTLPSTEEETGSLELNFTGDELVRAFVMQEILTRPCQRRGQAM